jgi:hypothetical protein
LRGPILQNEKVDCTSRLEELKASWEITGCTVMSDGWTDQKGRTLLNFLVNCPRGTMFIKSVDASAHIKDALLLCELLDGFIREVGPQQCCPSHNTTLLTMLLQAGCLCRGILPCFGLLVLHIVLI